MSSHCRQPAEPDFDYGECPAVGVGGRHSEAYGDDGEWICNWCGARPYWPFASCNDRVHYDCCRIYPLHRPARRAEAHPTPCIPLGPRASPEPILRGDLHWLRELGAREVVHLYERHATAPDSIPCGEADCPLRDAVVRKDA